MGQGFDRLLPVVVAIDLPDQRAVDLDPPLGRRVES
jgi:hypothetical protein